VEYLVSLSWCICQGTHGEGDGNADYLPHTVRGLQVIMDALQDTSEKYNMLINTKKTKIMTMSTVEGRTMKITVNGQNLE